MKFSHASRLLHSAIGILRVMGWAWRWAELWVDYNSSWEPLLEPGEREEDMTKQELKIVESTRESRCEDARKCRLAAFGAALRNRAYDQDGDFDREAFDHALRAILRTESLVGPLEEDFEIDFFAWWLALAYWSKSRLLGFADDKIEINDESPFCRHVEDGTPKSVLGSRPLPGRRAHATDIDDFMRTQVITDEQVALLRTAAKISSAREGYRRSSRAFRSSEELADEQVTSSGVQSGFFSLPTKELESTSITSSAGEPIKRDKSSHNSADFGATDRIETSHPPKRKRGRPPKSKVVQEAKVYELANNDYSLSSESKTPRGRGRPPKSTSVDGELPKRGRGRPPKNPSDRGAPPKRGRGRPPKRQTLWEGDPDGGNTIAECSVEANVAELEADPLHQQDMLARTGVWPLGDDDQSRSSSEEPAAEVIVVETSVQADADLAPPPKRRRMQEVTQVDRGALATSRYDVVKCRQRQPTARLAMDAFDGQTYGDNVFLTDGPSDEDRVQLPTRRSHVTNLKVRVGELIFQAAYSSNEQASNGLQQGKDNAFRTSLGSGIAGSGLGHSKTNKRKVPDLLIVDEETGQRVCRRCHLGKSFKSGHAHTCPESVHYRPPSDADNDDPLQPSQTRSAEPSDFLTKSATITGAGSSASASPPSFDRTSEEQTKTLPQEEPQDAIPEDGMADQVPETRAPDRDQVESDVTDQNANDTVTGTDEHGSHPSF